MDKVELSARRDDLGIDYRLVAGEPLPRRRSQDSRTSATLARMKRWSVGAGHLRNLRVH